jgi:hypothetical protein
MYKTTTIVARKLLNATCSVPFMLAPEEPKAQVHGFQRPSVSQWQLVHECVHFVSTASGSRLNNKRDWASCLPLVSGHLIPRWQHAESLGPCSVAFASQSPSHSYVWSSVTSLEALMYKTLLPRMKASPYWFCSCPSTYSSVCSIAMFIYPSKHTRIPEEDLKFF